MDHRPVNPGTDRYVGPWFGDMPHGPGANDSDTSQISDSTYTPDAEGVAYLIDLVDRRPIIALEAIEQRYATIPFNRLTDLLPADPRQRLSRCLTEIVRLASQLDLDERTIFGMIDAEWFTTHGDDNHPAVNAYLVASHAQRSEADCDHDR